MTEAELKQSLVKKINDIKTQQTHSYHIKNLTVKLIAAYNSDKYDLEQICAHIYSIFSAMKKSPKEEFNKVVENKIKGESHASIKSKILKISKIYTTYEHSCSKTISQITTILKTYRDQLECNRRYSEARAYVVANNRTKLEPSLSNERVTKRPRIG